MKRLSFLFAFLFSALFLISCFPEPDPPRAVISVYTVDDNGTRWPARNCEVRLDIPPGTSQNALINWATEPEMTDPNGQVVYDFLYEGILNVIAEKGDGANSCGRGAIILKEGSVYHEEIRLTGCETL